MKRENDYYVCEILINQSQDREKARSVCPGQVRFALGQVKMEVWWFGGQVKLASEVLFVIISNKKKTISKLVTAR